MKKICLLILCGLLVGACSANKKPALEQTQIVDGKSIVMPPEFYVLPKAKNQLKTEN
ncbi:MAG: hypothetical protein IKZ02_03865 [Alphaproteobacteria bacterium]|nr:hypothetical protein [Alphaproteobacteria bacterium]